jgi:hypothetical protein
MQPPQERQTWRWLPIEQHDCEVGGGDPLIKRLVVFEDLPWAYAFLSDQQNERSRIRYLGRML